MSKLSGFFCGVYVLRVLFFTLFMNFVMDGLRYVDIIVGGVFMVLRWKLLFGDVMVRCIKLLCLSMAEIIAVMINGKILALLVFVLICFGFIKLSLLEVLID